MKKLLCTALLLCAILAGCADNNDQKEDSSQTTDEATTSQSVTGDDGEENTTSADSDDTGAFSFTPPGKLIEPEEDSEEYGLGSYRISADGVKLYWEEDEYPLEIVLTLEKYFTAFADEDYSTYKKCIYPGYIDEYEAFLERDYGYGMDTSFKSQCANLQDIMGGEFQITRIKLETPEEVTEESFKHFFDSLNDIFEKDYYSQVRNECDELYDAYFYVIAQDSEGAETTLISSFEIVFAEKDGRYYVFG